MRSATRASCPSDCLYVPANLKSELLQCAPETKHLKRHWQVSTALSLSHTVLVHTFTWILSPIFLSLAAIRSSYQLSKGLVRWPILCPCLRCHQLLWVEYAHNIWTSTTTHLFLFQCAYGYQPPLFFSCEKDTVCPSALSLVHKFKQTWVKAHAELFCPRRLVCYLC